MLLSDKTNDVDFAEIRQRILKTRTAQELNLDVVKYRFDPAKDNVPVNAALQRQIPSCMILRLRFLVTWLPPEN